VRLEGLEHLRPILEALPGPAYLVGGIVRDLLLYRPGFDVDLAVVGDAEAYANALAERLGGRVVAHGRFGTAVVHYGEGRHLDVAMARTETYPAPGALPEVRGLSGARVREELVAILGEERAPAILRRLRQLGVDEALHPGLRFPEDGTLLERLRHLAAQYAPAPQWELGLLAIGPPPGWLDELKAPRWAVSRIESAAQEAPFLRARLRRPDLTPADVVEAVEGTGPDTPLLALAQEDLPALHDYFLRLRDVHIELTGDDLAALGLGESPRVGEVLAELRRRKLNGELDSRAAEIAVARDLIAET